MIFLNVIISSFIDNLTKWKTKGISKKYTESKVRLKTCQKKRKGREDRRYMIRRGQILLTEMIHTDKIQFLKNKSKSMKGYWKGHKVKNKRAKRKEILGV